MTLSIGEDIRRNSDQQTKSRLSNISHINIQNASQRANRKYCKRAIFYVLFVILTIGQLTAIFIVVQLLNYILARIVASIFGACFCAFCLKNRPIQDGRDFTYEIEEKWDQLENEKKFDYILSNWVN
eukprot:260231_1